VMELKQDSLQGGALQIGGQVDWIARSKYVLTYKVCRAQVAEESGAAQTLSALPPPTLFPTNLPPPCRSSAFNTAISSVPAGMCIELGNVKSKRVL